MTSDPTTWTDLKAELALWIDRDDLAARVPVFIALAERKFNRVLRVPEMEASTILSLNAATVALPADFLAMRSIHINSDPKVVLEQMGLDALRNRYAGAATGKPRNFAIQAGATLVPGPTPDSAYSAPMTYFQTIAALGSGQASNWLLAGHPDIYLYGSLIMAESYMVNDGRIAVWKLALEEALEELRRQGHRKAYGAAPLRIRAAQPV